MAYRDQGSGQQSSSVWVRVFDPLTRKELRSARLETAAVPLPDRASRLLISLDGLLLVYSELHLGVLQPSRTSTLIIVLDAATLAAVSQTTTLPSGMREESPGVRGVSSDDKSVLITSQVTDRRLNSADVRLVGLAVRDLTQVISDTVVPNTYEDSFGFFTNKGYLYRPNASSKWPVITGPNEMAGVTDVYLSPDERYGVALCERPALDVPWNSRTAWPDVALIFETKTRKILHRVLMDEQLYPELAVCNGNGEIILATAGSPGRLKLHRFSQPR